MSQDGTDYVGVNKALTFQPGQSVHTVSIQFIDDDITEDNEFFTASLIVSKAGTQAPSPQDTLITIIDNDGMLRKDGHQVIVNTCRFHHKTLIMLMPLISEYNLTPNVILPKEFLTT